MAGRIDKAAVRPRRGRSAHDAYRPREVFLSHSHEDLPFTRLLATGMRDHGVAVWYSERDIAGARQWHDEIGAALARCDWFLLVLTPAAVRSRWVKRELLHSLDSEAYDDRVIPIIAKSCDFAKLSWTLSSFQMTPYSKRPYAEAMRDLLRIWGIGYRGDAAP